MGTVDEKLSKLLGTKADIKAAIIEKGQEAGDVFSSYADKIRAIETGITPDISIDANGLITATSGSKSATKQLTTQAAKTITPSSSVQTAVPAGVYTTGAVMVASANVAKTATVRITNGTSSKQYYYANGTMNNVAAGGTSSIAFTVPGVIVFTMDTSEDVDTSSNAEYLDGQTNNSSGMRWRMYGITASGTYTFTYE